MKKEKYIYSNLTEGKKKYGEPDKVFRYRGYELGIWDDDAGQALFTIWHGEERSFGTYNLNFEDDCHYIIDNELDNIYCDHNGMTIKWHQDEWSEFRDIVCYFRMRLVKVWLVDDPDQVDIEAIKKEGRAICDELEAKRLAERSAGYTSKTYISDLMKEDSK